MIKPPTTSKTSSKPSPATGNAPAQQPSHQPLPELATRDPARVPPSLRRFAKSKDSGARKFRRDW